MKAKEAQDLAYTQAQKIEFNHCKRADSTFHSIKFNIPKSQFVDQAIVAKQNLLLDPEGCLGRVAVTAAIMEQCHSALSLRLGEVWDDYLKNIMLRKLRENPSNIDDPSFMQELLMYEEPHAIIVIENTQFEPLSLELDMLIEHPKVELFPLWEGLAASATVSEAWLKEDPAEKLQLLKKAEKLCPELTLVRENMAGPYELLGQLSEAIASVRWALERRPCARTLYVMYLLTEDKQYYNRLTEIYTNEVIKYF